jgi:adenylyl- and sulfurtransferase ThiI
MENESINQTASKIRRGLEVILELASETFHYSVITPLLLADHNEIIRQITGTDPHWKEFEK